MIKVLLIHNTDLTNQEYKRQFVKKYKHFSEHSDTWVLTVIKLGSKMSKKNYDKIYFDEGTVKHSDIYDNYVVANRKSADVLPVKNENSKMKVNVVTRIKDMK